MAGTVKPPTSPRPRAMYSSCMLAEWQPTARGAPPTVQRAPPPRPLTVDLGRLAADARGEFGDDPPGVVVEGVARRIPRREQRRRPALHASLAVGATGA